MGKEYIKIIDHIAYMHYEGFDLVSGDDGIPISDFIYKVDEGYVIEFIEQLRQSPIDPYTLPLLLQVYMEQVLEHFREEARQWKVQELENMGEEEPIC